MEDEIWTTRDGRKIAVGDMDEQHVRNTLRMILRNRRRMQERVEKRPALLHLVRLLLGSDKRATLSEQFERELEESLMEDRKWGDS